MHLFFEKAELPICNSRAKNNNWALVQLTKVNQFRVLEGLNLYNGTTFHHIEVIRKDECCKKCLRKAVNLQMKVDIAVLKIFKILTDATY